MVKCIALNGNFWIFNKNYLKYVPYGLLHHMVALVQIMPWCWKGHNPLLEQIDGILPKGPYLPCIRMADRALLAGYPPNDGPGYWQVYASLCFVELSPYKLDKSEIMITWLIWTILTPMSSVPKKADKLNLSLSLSLRKHKHTFAFS